jgi:pyrroloquinoline quinone (PQQ) biosynthesis protein C
MRLLFQVEEAWRAGFDELRKGEFLNVLWHRGFTQEHYVGFLRETYHNASMNPRLGSLFHAHLDGGSPALEARFLKHNASEVGHNLLALADLAAMGEDAEAVRLSRPLPQTEALAAFAAFQIQFRNPLAYLGYLYHLEAIAVTLGEGALANLAKAEIPRGAFSFLKEHAEADQAHLQLNRQYIEGFVRNEGDLEAVLYGVRGACTLYGLMLQGIADRVKAANPPDHSAD